MCKALEKIFLFFNIICLNYNDNILGIFQKSHFLNFSVYW